MDVLIAVISFENSSGINSHETSELSTHAQEGILPVVQDKPGDRMYPGRTENEIGSKKDILKDL